MSPLGASSYIIRRALVAQGVLDLENLVSVRLGRSFSFYGGGPPPVNAWHIEALRGAEIDPISSIWFRKCWFLGLQN